MLWRALWVCLCLLATPALGKKWEESDFPPRAVVAYPFSDEPVPARHTLVGRPRSFDIEKGDTLWDVARHLGLGMNEVESALPDVDIWVPPVGESIEFPTWWVLPRDDRRGIVVNIPEMRLYYYPAGGNGVITYPVGLGRIDWKTPTSTFRITEKTENPVWVIPDGILAERIREKGRSETAIPGGHPENPLGRYRMRLSLREYGIHGTNIPWGVGMHVSHGCLRLYPEDIERLYPIVPVGTPGEIVYQPLKMGVRNGRIFAEAHADVYETGFDYEDAAREILEAEGWSDRIDRDLLARALERRSGVPTAISAAGALLPEKEPEPAIEAARREEPSLVPEEPGSAAP